MTHETLIWAAAETAKLFNPKGKAIEVEVRYDDGTRCVFPIYSALMANAPNGEAATETISLRKTETIPEPDAPEIEFRHSADYHTCRVNGEMFVLSDPQAAIVKLLHEAALNGTPYLGSKYLLEQTDCMSEKLSQIFTSLPNWKNLVVEGERKGTYRLNC